MSLPAPVLPAGPTAPNGEWSPGVRMALVGLAYFALARLGLGFATVTANVSPVWPASGLALGALLVGGLRLWPGVACGALAAAISTGAGAPAAVMVAVGNTLEAVVTAALLRRWLNFQDDFEEPRQVVGYVVLHGCVGAPLSALFGVVASLLEHQVTAAAVGPLALTWWGGNFTGGLVVGPLLIGVNQMLQRIRQPGQKRELAGLLTALIAVAGAVFAWGPAGGAANPALLVLPFPLLIWIAWRFSIGGAALSLVVVSVFAVWSAAHGTGPFLGRSLHESHGYLLMYLVVVALTALVLAAFNVQRERVLARLRQREWQLSEAQRIANLGVWVWDLRTDVFYLSDGGVRVLGVRRAQVEPRIESLLGRLDGEDRLIMEEMLRRVRLSDRRETCEVRIRPEGAPLRHVGVACTVVRDGRGEPVELLGTLFDFSERKRHEEEQVAVERKLLETQKLESLGLLAGGIAHDFNNLLTGILGNASLLRLQLPEASGMGEGLRRIESSAERAADLCRQMLAYSGKGRFVVRTVELNELVQGTLALARTSLPKNAAIVFEAAGAAARVRADMLQLRQVLLNLVLNAAEALPAGGGRVLVRTGTMAVGREWLAGAYLAPELPSGDYAYLEIADTGCGVAPEIRAKIFDPFFSTKFTGRGLGLAAVAGIVRAHHGAVRVESAPGAGATFRVVLPLAREEARAAAAVPPVAPPAPVPRPAAVGPASWLVVDDEAAVRQVAADLLGRAGLVVVEAADGLQALELFGAAGHGFQAVLLDFSMPRLDGLETFKQLRARRADIPVVLMSGFEAEKALERFAGLGITGFLQKPFSLRSLSETVAKVTHP